MTNPLEEQDEGHQEEKLNLENEKLRAVSDNEKQKIPIFGHFGIT